MAAVITEEEKNRARHHMGYPEVEAVSTFALGVPAAMQTNFMIEGAMQRINASPGAVERFRQLLCRMDGVENELECGMDLASVDRIDTIEVRSDRVNELGKYYRYWQTSLANLLGIVPNPWDQRSFAHEPSVNVSVIG